MNRAFRKRRSLHLALYESAYATTPKVVETVVSEIPEVGFKILTSHVKRTSENPCYDECETENSMVLYDNPCISCEGTETQMTIYENPSYYDETNDAPMLASDDTSKTIDDNALDDGPIFIDNPPCLELVTTLCEDKDDIIAVYDDALTHESPTLFLNSPNNTIEEKFAYVEKYLCGLQLSLVPNLCCNHDIKLDSDNYFERGKHANECLGSYNDPLYMKNMHALNGYNNIFASSKCNYYERGGDKSPLYVTNNHMLQVNVVNMHWETSIYGDSFIYKMPMHRKKIRLRCYYLCVLFFSLLSFNLIIIFIGVRTLWDPGIILGRPFLRTTGACMEHFPRMKGTTFKLPHELHLR